MTLLPARFASRDFGRHTTFSSGKRDRFDGVFTLDDFRRAIVGGTEPGRGRVQPAPLRGFARGTGSSIPNLPPQLAMELFDAGVTLCADHLEDGHAGLQSLVATLRAELGFNGRAMVSAFYSADGAGADWHWDGQHVFVLQLAGSKRWRVETTPSMPAAPFGLTALAMEHPDIRASLPSVGLTAKPPSRAHCIERTLRPGSLLYMPPGTWHQTFAGGHSFALTILLFPHRPVNVVMQAITRLATARESWRDDLDGERHLQTVIDELAALLATTRASDLLAQTIDPVQSTLLHQAARQFIGATDR